MILEDGNRNDWMSEDQSYCLDLVINLFKDERLFAVNYIDLNIKAHGRGIEFSASANWFATFDFDYLTKAVFLAHDMCIKLQIMNNKTNRIKLVLNRRHRRDGADFEKHPTIEEALSNWRVKNPRAK